MQSDDAVGRIIYELQFLRGVADSIQQRIELINSTVSEMQSASSTLEGIGSEEPGSSILVPIGGGSYIRVKLDDKEKAIVVVGADVAVEKTIGEAREDLQARILEFEKARTSLQQQLDDTSTKMSGLQREFQRLNQQASGRAGDVRGP